MRLIYANCLSCHNSEKHKGGLELITRAAALKGGDDGPVIVPGKPDKSLILKALAPDADPHMPPKKQLTTNQIGLMRRWITAGASWDEATLTKASAPREVVLGSLPNSYQPVFAIVLSLDGKQLAISRGNRILVHEISAANFRCRQKWKRIEMPFAHFSGVRMAGFWRAAAFAKSLCGTRRR